MIFSDFVFREKETASKRSLQTFFDPKQILYMDILS